jgi:hypothetical protein
LKIHGLVIGLPFSDKKIIPQDTEQDGTDGSSVGIPPVSQKKKPHNSVPNHFSKEKNPQNAVPNHFLEEKYARNSILNHFSEEKNPWNSVPNHFWMRKTLGILFRTIFGREKPRKSVPNNFRKRKNLGIPFRIIPKYLESHGISTLFCGITKTVPCLFCGIFSERNFDGNPSWSNELSSFAIV